MVNKFDADLTVVNVHEIIVEFAVLILEVQAVILIVMIAAGIPIDVECHCRIRGFRDMINFGSPWQNGSLLDKHRQLI